MRALVRRIRSPLRGRDSSERSSSSSRWVGLESLETRILLSGSGSLGQGDSWEADRDVAHQDAIVLSVDPSGVDSSGETSGDSRYVLTRDPTNGEVTLRAGLTQGLDLTLSTSSQSPGVLIVSDRGDPGANAEIDLEFLTAIRVYGSDEYDDILSLSIASDLELEIFFDGGEGGFDTLALSGVSVGSYTPGETFGEGVIQAGMTTIHFIGLEPITIDGATTDGKQGDLDASGLPSEFTFTPHFPSDGSDTIFIDSFLPGTNRIYGHTDNLTFEYVEFTNVAKVTLDLGHNDRSSSIDIVRINAPLAATGLTEFVIDFGGGANNTLVVNTRSLGLPFGGEFKVTAEDFTLTDTVWTGGADFVLEVEHDLTVASGVAVATRQFDPDNDTGLSTGPFGAITLTAETIVLESGAGLFARDDSGFAPGDVTLTARETPDIVTPVIVILDTDASITLTDATVKGGAVSITSFAGSAAKYNAAAAAAGGTLTALFKLFEFLVPSPAGVAISTADATTRLLGTTLIEGTDVLLGSSAVTEASVRTVFTAVGASYGRSEPSALTFLDTGTVVTATGNVDLRSTTNSVLDILAVTANLGGGRGSKKDVSFALGEAYISSITRMAEGSMVTAGGDFSAQALSTITHAISAVAGAFEDGTLGVGAAFSLMETNVAAIVQGNVDAGGNVQVRADSTALRNDLGASSGVGSGLITGAIIKAANALIDMVPKIADKASKNSTTKLAASAAFAYAKHDTYATAQLGPLVFEPKASVDDDDDEIDFGMGHGYLTGDKVIYHSGGGAPIGGLTDGAVYYVIREDAGTIKLAASLSDAQDETALPISGSASSGAAHRFSDPITAVARSGNLDVLAKILDEPELVVISTIDSDQGGRQRGERKAELDQRRGIDRQFRQFRRRLHRRRQRRRCRRRVNGQGRGGDSLRNRVGSGEADPRSGLRSECGRQRGQRHDHLRE